MRRISTVWQKIGASAVNISIVCTISLPILLVNGYEVWRPCVIGLWFVYNLLFRARCIGMMCMGTVLQQPASLRYVTLYTAGFSTLWYSVIFSCDLLLANAFCQAISVHYTGGTIYSALSGEYTFNERQDLRASSTDA
jgi:hypothetical protein